VIDAHGYLVFYQDVHFGNVADPGCIEPFALSENGETVYLSSADGGEPTGYRDQEDFGPSETNVAFGRYQKSGGTFNFVAMSENTPGAENAYPKVGPIVISELMYNPQSGDQNEEYIELHNTSESAVELYDEEGIRWRFTDGIDFTFPYGTSIPAGGYMLVVKEPQTFMLTYSPPDGVPVLGPYSGRLDNGGERVQISMPGDVDPLGQRQYIRVDRVNYDDESPWPTEPDGGGRALDRIDPAQYGNDVVNWQGAPPSPGW